MLLATDGALVCACLAVLRCAGDLHAMVSTLVALQHNAPTVLLKVIITMFGTVWKHHS